MNQTQFIDELEKRGLTKKEAKDSFKKLEQSKLFKTFTSFSYLAYSNRVTPKICIPRTESLCGEVHVLGFMQNIIEKVEYEVHGKNKPLLLLRLFVSNGAPPDYFRYTGTEQLFAVDLSLPDCGYLPEEVGEATILFHRNGLQAMLDSASQKNRVDTERKAGLLSFKQECGLQLYAFRQATTKEREAVFALYNVNARAAEEYNPKKTKQNPKGAGRKPVFDHKEDARVFSLWEKWRAQPGNGRLGKKEFIEATGLDITDKALEKLLNRTQKRRRT